MGKEGMDSWVGFGWGNGKGGIRGSVERERKIGAELIWMRERGGVVRKIEPFLWWIRFKRSVFGIEEAHEGVGRERGKGARFDPRVRG